MKNSRNRILWYGVLSLFLTLTFTSYPAGKARAEDVQGWNSAASATFDHWRETLSMPAEDLKIIRLGETLSKDGELYPFESIGSIYGITISGVLQLNAERSLVRVILVDNHLREHLIYEAYPLIVDAHLFSVSNVCEETCLLEPVEPRSLKVELVDASLRIDEVSLAVTPVRAVREIAQLRKEIKRSQNAAKIERLRDQIKKRGLKWTVGETSVSELFYEEKKRLFGGERVPNLQGAEYYKGGIFEIRSGGDASPLANNGGSSLIESFDWRSRHGANRPDSPYYDGDPTGSGWMTSITSQNCADCWAHSAVGATEALANLYFNQHLDVYFGLDLSVQDILSCSGGGSCSGGFPWTALYYISTTGVVDEACFPYRGANDPCGNKCVSPSEIIRIGGVEGLSPIGLGDEGIKRKLIERGPLNFGISSWWHSMVLVGYDKDASDGKTLWILKNSWGPGWGENGYGKIKVELSDVYLLYALYAPVTSLGMPFEIDCLDLDGDGYYNWGISETKPSTCPGGIPDERDCDDSNPLLGPFGPGFACVKETHDHGAFTLCAEREIEMDEIGSSSGLVGSNGKIEIKGGAGGPLIGGLYALDRIKNKGRMTIVGDVVTRKTLDDDGRLTVTGEIREHATLDPCPIPKPIFTIPHDAPDMTVREHDELEISPGAYGKIKVEEKATLRLSSGEYYLERLETKEKAKVLLEVAAGPVILNIEKKLDLDERVTMEIVGQGSTHDITINVLQRGTIKVDEKAVVRGTLNAPYAHVEFKKKSRLYGAVNARKIELDEDVHFEPHPPGE